MRPFSKTTNNILFNLVLVIFAFKAHFFFKNHSLDYFTKCKNKSFINCITNFGNAYAEKKISHIK